MTTMTDATTAAAAFARRNGVPARPGRQCMDGRYPLAGADSGRLARPGGDLGYVLAVLALNQAEGLGWQAGDCLDAVVGFCRRAGDDFAYHTDAETEANATGTDANGANLSGAGAPPAIGCRHIARALDAAVAREYLPHTTTSDPAAAARLSADLALVLRRLAGDDWTGPPRRRVVLAGPHQEQGVLLVTDVAVTLNHTDLQASYFVYDEARDAALVADLAALLGLDDGQRDRFAAIVQQQATATLRAIAPTLPWLRVTLAGREPALAPLT